MREWKELFFHGMPLYEGDAVENPASEPTQEQARETKQLEILNNQDYDEYTVGVCIILAKNIILRDRAVTKHLLLQSFCIHLACKT